MLTITREQPKVDMIDNVRNATIDLDNFVIHLTGLLPVKMSDELIEAFNVFMDNELPKLPGYKKHAIESKPKTKE